VAETMTKAWQGHCVGRQSFAGGEAGTSIQAGKGLPTWTGNCSTIAPALFYYSASLHLSCVTCIPYVPVGYVGKEREQEAEALPAYLLK
jgi:hypothetical protein